MNTIAVLLLMIFGGVGLAASIYIPHHDGFTSDHAIGAGLCGSLWMVACTAIAMIVLLH